MKSKFHSILALAAAFCVGGFYATPANAAAILFTPAVTISGDSDVSTTGTLNLAYNFGTTGITATTVNGVTFAAYNVGAQPSDTAITSTFTPDLAGSTGGFTSTSNPYNSLSASYKTLLSSAIYQGGVRPTTSR